MIISVAPFVQDVGAERPELESVVNAVGITSFVILILTLFIAACTSPSTSPATVCDSLAILAAGLFIIASTILLAVLIHGARWIDYRGSLHPR